MDSAFSINTTAQVALFRALHGHLHRAPQRALLRRNLKCLVTSYNSSSNCCRIPCSFGSVPSPSNFNPLIFNMNDMIWFNLMKMFSKSLGSWTNHPQFVFVLPVLYHYHLRTFIPKQITGLFATSMHVFSFLFIFHPRVIVYSLPLVPSVSLSLVAS